MRTFADSLPLEEIAHYPTHSASATALSLNHTTLSSQLEAPIKAVHVQVSQRVAKGDLLVSLDCSDYELAQQLAQARLKAATARLELATSQRQRNEQLLAKKLSSQETSDTTTAEALARSAEYDEAKIGLRLAQLDQSRCNITAPFDGIIYSRDVSEAQLARVGTALVTIVDTSRIELSARIDPADIPLLKQSKQLYFQHDHKTPVVISQLGGVVDSSTRSQEVRFTFPEHKPLPGSAGKLVWIDPRPFIPAQYIIKRGMDYGVFINRDGKAEFIVIQNAIPGRSNPTALALDTLIVTSGLGTLKNDAKL